MPLAYTRRVGITKWHLSRYTHTSHQSRVVGAISPDILQFALIINMFLLRPTDVQGNHSWTSLVIHLSFCAFLSSNHGRW